MGLMVFSVPSCEIRYRNPNGHDCIESVKNTFGAEL